MKRNAKVTALIAAIMMIVSLFAGCSKTSDTAQGNSAAATAATASTAAAASSATAAATSSGNDVAQTGTGFPDQLTLVATAGTPSIGGDTPESQAAFCDAVKKATGTTLTLINDKAAETLVATKIAAGETVDLYNGSIGNLKVQDAVATITPDMIKSTLNLNQVPQMYWNNFKNKDGSGTYYGIPYRSMMRTVMLIRQDWLDALNLKAPTTIDEFYNVSKAFATSDPDKNEKNDTYGYSASNQWDSLYYFFCPIQGALSKYEGNYAFDTTAKKLLYVPFQDDYKTFLSYLQKSYTEKIIDPEIFTNQHENMLNKFESGKTGIIVYFVGNLDDIVAKTKAVNPNANVVPIAPPTGPAGKGFYAVTSGNGWAILKSAKNPQGCMAFLDWITGGEGQQLLCYGPEGFNYTISNNQAYLKQGVTNITMGLNPSLVILQDQFKAIVPNSELVDNSLKINEANLKFDNSVTMPINPMADQEMTLFQEFFAKIVSGKLTVDAGMEAWKKEFASRGLQKYYDDANKDISWAPAN